MRVVSRPGRWTLCFVALPFAWIVASLLTGLHAALMIPAAALVAVACALTAHRRGLSSVAVAGYFIGAAVMMGVAFAIALVTILTITCGDASC